MKYFLTINTETNKIRTYNDKFPWIMSEEKAKSECEFFAGQVIRRETSIAEFIGQTIALYDDNDLGFYLISVKKFE